MTCAGSVLGRARRRAVCPVLTASLGEPLRWGNKDGSSGRLSHLPEITQHTPSFCGAVAQGVRGGVVFILTTVARPGPPPPLWRASMATQPKHQEDHGPPVTQGAREPVATHEGLFLNPREQHRLSLEVASVQAVGGCD